MTRSSRLTLSVAVLAAALSGLASSAQVDDAPIGPHWEDPSEAELAFYDAEFPCPEIEGLEQTWRDVSALGEVRIRCDYGVPERSDSVSFSLRWLKPDYDRYASSICDNDRERSDDGVATRDDVRLDPGVAVVGEYSVFDVAWEAPLLDAFAPLQTKAVEYARGCAEEPTLLECPEIPGHPVDDFFTPEVRVFQPDMFEMSCSYSASSETSGDQVTVKVWWASRDGVPSLLDRVCNEPAFEGTGFGVIPADGVAAVATFWRHSPLEGPDVAVARAAAEDLLAQAVAVAPDCSGAEVFPTTYSAFPAYIAPSFTAELTARPAGGGGSGLGGLPSVPSTPGASDDGWIQTALRIGSVVMFAVSMLGLFITFLLIRRETRIRERRDLLRIGITLTVAVLAVVIVGRDAPLWAVLVAVGLGLTIGTWQGSNLLVRSTERGLYARRNLIAIVAFAAGILLMQAAGFLNRTGGVALGVAASFLSAALTAGLFLGRKPRMTEAVSAAARAVLPVAMIAGVLAGFGVASGSAQTTPAEPWEGTCDRVGFYLDFTNCPGYEHLLDVVPWDGAFVIGGLWWSDGKPPTPLAVPRGLSAPPDAVTETVSWETTDSSGTVTSYEVTETFTFGSLLSGGCCSVAYEASGTRTFTQPDGTTTIDTYEVAGRLEDIHPLGTSTSEAGWLGIPFTEVLTLRGLPEDSCQRAVAWRQEDNEEGAATWASVTINGEDSSSFVSSEVTLFIDCELPEFTYQNAFALAPPPPATGDPDRVVGALGADPGETCPVRQEFMRYVWNAGMFEGVDTLTLAELYLEPNSVQCDYGSLFSPVSFGQGGRGNTRHELLYRLAILNDPVAEARRLADDEDTFFLESRLASIPEHERCELGADGVPLPPEGFDTAGEGPIPTCTYITIHSAGATSGVSGVRSAQIGALNALGGQVYIETQYVFDGPNVIVRAHLPWGKYVYTCHHCTPGDPRIGGFLSSLHRFGTERGFGDPDSGQGEVAPTPPPDDETQPVDPAESEGVEFTPIEEEGLTEEEAALIGLVGLLGSLGVLGATLEGTGLTAGDITSAIRRGDLTGGVGTEEPPLLDEDGDPLFVNDGSYEEAPVGDVWWSTGGEEGRWVSQEEAQELVSEARVADEAYERDRADALARQRALSEQDWQDLIQRSRSQAAADRANAAMERARSEIIFGRGFDPETGEFDSGELGALWDAAVASGEQDLIDFIDRNDGLTAEQIGAVYDALNRRAADEAALSAIPEVNVWAETATGTLDDLADIADKAGQPGIAWILRNPVVAARVGAAVATGGWSEFVAVPIDITNRLHEAQQRSIRENGRMMTSGELFGELGWALGTEAVYEVGGRLVGAGLGRVFSSGDELAEQAIRRGEEAVPTMRPRVGDELLAPAGRTSAEVAEGVSRETLEEAAEQVARRTATQGAEEVGEQAARRGAAEGAEEVGEQAARRGAAEGAEEAAEGAARQGEELMQPPPKGNEGIRELETGAPIRGDMVEQTGLPRQQLDGLEDYARQNDLNMTGRATNPYSRPALEAGDAIPKPLDIKIKTGNDLDVLLGANPANRGQVTLFEPRMPDTRGMSPDLVEALNRRHAQRMAEWNKYSDAWTRGDRVISVKGTERTHRLVNGRIEVLSDGQWRGYAGDFDLVDITRADGTPLSPAEFQRHVDSLVERGLIEHGGEVRVMTDIMRNSPHPPGSAEWMQQARQAWDLRNSLENAHLDSGEIIVGINGTHGLHRGPRIEDALPWRGGFETPSGQLLDGSTFVVDSGAVRPLDLGTVRPPDLGSGASALMRGMDDD